MLNFIDVSSLKYELSEAVFTKSEKVIKELMRLLEEGAVLKVGYSTGKDSSTVLNASIEAMRRCLEQGTIETTRPLVVITVDTTLEPYNLSCYVPHAHKLVKAYCDSLGINLEIEVASPPLYQQLMVLFAGTQKLLPSARSGRTVDCSIIWKLDSSRRCLEKIQRRLPARYRSAHWVDISGSRTDESQRRKNNMRKAGTDSRTAASLIQHWQSLPVGYSITNFAPISDWDTRDVINYLTHAGQNPVQRPSKQHSIRAFCESFGLLLALYGEGSDDVCSVTSQSTCGGTARYGCQCCPVVSDDHSGKEIMQYPRWARFGDDVLRFRDYFVRVSLDVRHRAYHPRATCGVTSNIYLQPNVLKANVLENLLYYAAQITEKQKRIHEEFCERLASGDIDNDEGVLDIMSDPTLSDAVKREYREAYIARMSDAPMLSLFTEQHAVLLSALWSLNGVKSTPYRPMKILDAVQHGKSKPFPMLNSELNDARRAAGLPDWDDASVLNKTVPDALVYQLFTPVKTFNSEASEQECLAHSPINLTEYSSQATPVLTPDADGRFVNRHNMTALHNLRLKVVYRIDDQGESLSVKRSKRGVNFDLPTSSNAHQQLLLLAKDKLHRVLVKKYGEDMTTEDMIAQHLSQHDVISIEFLTEMPECKEFSSAYPALRETKTNKRQSGVRFTMRKRSKERDGKWVAGRTSLQDYVPSTRSSQAEQFEQHIGYWLPDRSQKRVQLFQLHDYNLDEELVGHMEYSIDIDDTAFQNFIETHWNTCIANHNQALLRSRSAGLGARTYQGTAAFHYLMNHAGLIMSTSFESYVQRSLARTELFHSSALYQISDFDYQKLSQLPNVIFMSEHRLQKANHLKWIRRARNLSRRALSNKQQQATHQRVERVVQARIEEYFEHLQTELVGHAIYDAHYRLTDKDNAKQSVNELWLQTYSAGATHFDVMLKLLTTREEQKQILANLPCMQSLATFYAKAAHACLSHVRRELEGISKGVSVALTDLTLDDFRDDGFGNLELDDEALLLPIAEAFKHYGLGRNPFLLLTGMTHRVAYALGHNAEQGMQKATEKALSDCISALNSPVHPLYTQLATVNAEQAIRANVSVSSMAGAQGKLSDSKRQLLESLRKAS
ncbi:hypothetical protein ACPV5O_20960 [Vibrio maritimus]|uniref:hypothetical protein n=1 Tax=Vibrio maritimus TaxID=990268 RepID=UPI0040689D5E